MTGTDLILPDTGELVPIDTLALALGNAADVALNGTTLDRANLLDALRRLDAEVAQVKRLLSGAIQADSEILGKKTISLGDGRSAVISGGEETVVDPERYAAALRRAGMPEERVDEIVTATVTLKVNLVKAKQAASANEKYRRALARASTTRERAVSVRIEKG